jgi:hypothetical protein
LRTNERTLLCSSTATAKALARHQCVSCGRPIRVSQRWAKKHLQTFVFPSISTQYSWSVVVLSPSTAGAYYTADSTCSILNTFAMLTHEECDQFILDGAVTKPDPDISGIGVILAFLISAYVSFFVVLGAYLFGLVEPELLSPADVRFMRIKSRIHRHPRLHHLLQHAILVLSDQQIVTGVAIMAAGFVGLRSGDTNVYHYQIVLYLAWLSCSVHLSALTFLRPFLESHPAVRSWRLLGMVVLFFMLVVGLIPTVSYDWGIINISDPTDASIGKDDLTGWGIPARCFWARTYGDGVNNDAPIGYALLIVSYIWKVGDMFAPTRKLFNSGIRGPTERVIEQLLSIASRRYVRTRRKRHLWCFRLLLVPTIPFITLVEFLSSLSASLWLSMWGLVFGTIQVIVPRQQNLQQTAAKEGEWGFSQLVPMILLIQPLGALTEHMSWRQPITDLYQSEKAKSREAPKRSESTLAHQESSGYSSGPSQECKKSLIEILGRERPSQCESTTSQNSAPRLTDMVLSSRLGVVLLIMIQLTLLGGTCVILYFDVVSIGIVRGDNWLYALLSLAFYVGSSWLAMVVTSPFSRLARDPFEYDAVDNDVSVV